MKKLITNEAGQALVTVALMMVVLMGFAALTVDLGMVHLTRTKMQNAADAGALAAAGDLPGSTAKQRALEYAGLNGAEDTIANTYYNGDPDMIEVICTKNVPYTFARVLGLSDVNVSARAVAGKIGVQEVFNYTVFSGDPDFTLTFNGTNTKVNGSVHSNYKCLINGTYVEINGSAEALSAFTLNGTGLTISGTCRGSKISITGSNVHVGNQDPNPAPWVDMPDFSAAIRAEAEAAGQAYKGNQTFNDNNMSVDSPIYVDGNLTVNGTNFVGAGVVLVSGNIIFNGTNLCSLGGTSACFYSTNGNITINGTNIELRGLVYAPGGTITMNGTNQTVKGRVIGSKVVFNGTNYDIVSGTEELKSLPKTRVKLIE